MCLWPLRFYVINFMNCLGSLSDALNTMTLKFLRIQCMCLLKYHERTVRSFSLNVWKYTQQTRCLSAYTHAVTARNIAGFMKVTCLLKSKWIVRSFTFFESVNIYKPNIKQPEHWKIRMGRKQKQLTIGYTTKNKPKKKALESNIKNKYKQVSIGNIIRHNHEKLNTGQTWK